MNGLKDLIKAFGGVMGKLIWVFFAVALLVFFWGLVKFIFRVGGDEKAVEEGKNIMIWGVVSLFVMLTVWGLVEFLRINLAIPNATL